MSLQACRHLGIVALVVLSVAYPSVTQGQTAIRPSEITSVSAVSNKTRVRVTLRTSKYEKNGNSVVIVQSVEILVNDRPLFVPRSVFADLVDPREASVRFEGSTMILFVSGGDGADSYILQVYFDTTKVKERKLYSSLIPTKPTEDTRYWIRIMEDK